VQKDTKYSNAVLAPFSQAVGVFIHEQNLVTDDLQDHYENLISKLLDILTPIILKEVEEIHSTTTSDETDPRWMIELANQAVNENTQENGIPKYNSAQGYACALSAIKMMANYLPKKEDSSEDTSTQKKTPEEKEAILSHAREIYDHIKPKFGEEAASKQVAVHIAEQYGIVDWNDIGILPNEKEELLGMIVSKFEE
jgi:hypothetical protein